MKTNPKKLHPVPWPDLPGSYTEAELRREAKAAAKREGGRLLDWQILFHCNWATLQVRYLLEDGIARYTNVAI